MEVRSMVEKNLSKYTYHREQKVGRNRNIKDAPGEISEGNKGCVVVKWKKDDPCYKVK